ncbi:prenyltransferase/squalene oxidase repeat-containing protein [Streptosporangium sp. 'caverna']|uniref:prenyltransferase/squalene oxidase repeat-containing protein n=1 Tax=Streptosporangium sp. 'caverna' TaxID=2202249 RepID=UPI001EF81C52|nr:prenyltransferase/squalene oxidase repeat-containing protein [Streptosporangium sp. 'caverna']
MSVSDLLVSGTGPGRADARVDVPAEARDLVAGLVADPWGQVSASAYETGRLVSLAPWLSGHAGRVRFLLDTQRPDGTWGAPGGYALVPTLSATEALLAELRRTGHDGTDPDGSPQGGDAEHRVPNPGVLAGATRRGLWALERWSGEGAERFPLPDMPAIELIVPALISMINARTGPAGERLGAPAGMDGAKLTAIRAWLASGGTVPQKLLHALEVAGEAAVRAADVSPVPISAAIFGDIGAMGAIGASPAAGAAWLGAEGPSDPADPVLRYLEEIADRTGGPVPCATPITVFERGWALSWLLRAGVPVVVPPELTASLSGALGPEGVAAGPGLPPDADTTSVALYTLVLLEAPLEPVGLWPYETDTHFCTWRGEEGASPTVNAHVLDAFGEHLRRGTGAEPRYVAAVRKLSAWLCGRQAADGSWLDRWHASPYYATACCALALEDFGGEESADAVRGAVGWVLGSQREDGSWGRWEGTAEETAYALQILLLAGGQAGDGRCEEAVERGYRYLLGSVTDRGDPVDPRPLWHDKDLYFPAGIVRAAVLGALHLARRDTLPVCVPSPSPSRVAIAP